MTESTQKILAERLREMGYTPEITTPEKGPTTLTWETKKSIYEFYFDQKGDIHRAEIDGVYEIFKTRPYFSTSKQRVKWMVRGKQFGAVSRFFTLEKLLGFKLFEDK